MQRKMRAVADCRPVRFSANLIRDLCSAFGRSIIQNLSTPSHTSIEVKHEACLSSIAFDSKEGGVGVSSGKTLPECSTSWSYQLRCPQRNAMILMLENEPYRSRMQICESSLKRYSTMPSSAEGKGLDGPVVVDYSSLLSEKDFHDIADKTMEHLQERIEAYGEDLVLDGFDTDYAEGVLTVRLGSMGTYVMNKQTPNRQIWLSSPVSGPARFDWHEDGKSWLYRRTKADLVSLLQKELSQLLKADIDLNI